MACIEIRYKDQIFKITNGEQSDLYNRSDYSLLYNFLISGELPTGFYIEGNNLDRNELFDYLCNELNNGKDNNELYVGTLTSKSQEEFINKLIGNESLNNVIDDESVSYDHNVLMINSWGDTKNYYGFTNRRMILITGDNFFANRSATKSLAYVYSLVRANNQRIINTIFTLYKKYNNDYSNIYNQLTWLANHQLLELLSNIYTPNNSRFIPKDNKSINYILKNNISEVKGLYFKYRDNIYIIDHNEDNHLILARNIETNRDELIDIKNIRSIYKPIQIYHNNIIYYLINNKWYNKDLKKFNIVSNDLSDSLFQEYFGVTKESEERISTYSDNVTGNYKIGDLLLLDMLSEGTRVRTATGIYTKINGVYTNGDLDLDDVETIYDIYVTNNNDYNTVMQIKNLEPSDNILSTADLRIVLYDLFNIKDFSNISFSYKSKAPIARVTTKVIQNEAGQLQQVPKLELKYTIESNLGNYAEIALAVNYFNYLNNNKNIPSEVANINTFWKQLRDIVILHKENKFNDNITNIINILSEGISVNENLLDQTLEFSKETLYTNDNNFVNDLISKGLILYICEL